MTETTKITLRLPEELYEKIEQERGLIPRETWIRDQLTKATSERVPEARVSVRSSAEVKAGVKPVPKKK